MITATLKITKGKEQNNISASISHKDADKTQFKSWNFTGNLVSLKGYTTKDGVNYDEELVSIDCPTTAIIYNKEQGDAIFERCAEIFTERASVGDINPAVDLVLELKTVRPKETNILLLNITKAYVDADTQIIDTSETVEATIAKLKANSAKKQSERKQNLAARAGLKLVQQFTKTYL